MAGEQNAGEAHTIIHIIEIPPAALPQSAAPFCEIIVGPSA